MNTELGAIQRTLFSMNENLDILVKQLLDIERGLQKALSDAEAWKQEFMDMQRDKQKADAEVADLREKLDQIYRTPPALKDSNLG